MKEFFSETGAMSMMRLVTFMLVVTVILISLAMVYLVNNGKPTGELLALIGILLPVAIAGKVLQKKDEVKDDLNNQTPQPEVK